MLCIVVCACNCAYYAQMRALVTAIRLWRESEVLSPQHNIPTIHTHICTYIHACKHTDISFCAASWPQFEYRQLCGVVGDCGGVWCWEAGAVKEVVVRLHDCDKNFVGNCCCSCCWCYCCCYCIIATRCRTDVRLPAASASVDSVAMCM